MQKCVWTPKMVCVACWSIFIYSKRSFDFSSLFFLLLSNLFDFCLRWRQREPPPPPPPRLLMHSPLFLSFCLLCSPVFAVLLRREVGLHCRHVLPGLWLFRSWVGNQTAGNGWNCATLGFLVFHEETKKTKETSNLSIAWCWSKLWMPVGYVQWFGRPSLYWWVYICTQRLIGGVRCSKRVVYRLTIARVRNLKLQQSIRSGVCLYALKKNVCADGWQPMLAFSPKAVCHKVPVWPYTTFTASLVQLLHCVAVGGLWQLSGSMCLLTTTGVAQMQLQCTADSSRGEWFVNEVPVGIFPMT